MKLQLSFASLIRINLALMLSATTLLAQSPLIPPGASAALTAGEGLINAETGAGPSDQFVTGASAGSKPLIESFNGLSTAPTHRFLAYPAQMSAGVRVATGDVTGDSFLDIITATGPGSAPHVKVFDGVTGAEIRSFFAYTPSFFGGVFVAAADVDGDGFADIITGSDAGAGPHVKVFSGGTGAELASFFAFQGSFSGGVRVGAGDLTGDGRADIIVGAGSGINGHVKVFDGATNAEIRSFFAFSGFVGGVYVAAGDVNGDGRLDIIVGAEANGHVKVFDGNTHAEVRSFFAFPGFLGGATVAGGNIDNDRFAEIIVGAPPGVGGHVKVFSGRTGAELTAFSSYRPASPNGVYVGASPMAASDPRAMACTIPES